MYIVIDGYDNHEIFYNLDEVLKDITYFFEAFLYTDDEDCEYTIEGLTKFFEKTNYRIYEVGRRIASESFEIGETGVITKVKDN